MSGIKPDIFLREKWTSQATDGHWYKSVDRLHSNAVRRPKQKRHHNPLAQHNPLGRLQQQYLNGQICLAAITQRPIQRRPQLIETRSFTCQWTKQTKRFASSVHQIIHPQTGGWRIRLIVLHIWSLTRCAVMQMQMCDGACLFRRCILNRTCRDCTPRQ